MARLIKIGNSQGVRIPKAIIEQAQLEGQDLRFKVVDDGLMLQPVRRPRQGWKEQFDKAVDSSESARTDQDWLDAPLSSKEDWEW